MHFLSEKNITRKKKVSFNSTMAEIFAKPPNPTPPQHSFPLSSSSSSSPSLSLGNLLKSIALHVPFAKLTSSRPNQIQSAPLQFHEIDYGLIWSLIIIVDFSNDDSVMLMRFFNGCIGWWEVAIQL